MRARVDKVKQNSDVFLDLFQLTCRLPKTLVLFLHTTTVPEATREKSMPNTQTYVRKARWEEWRYTMFSKRRALISEY